MILMTFLLEKLRILKSIHFYYMCYTNPNCDRVK